MNDENKNNSFNSQEDLIKLADKMTRMMNYRQHAEQLSIPILEGFQMQETDNLPTVLFAQNNNYIEQIVSDGHLEGDSFDDRINSVIEKTKNLMKVNGCENTDNSFYYYKDYSNGVFNFKLYMCDIIRSKGNEKIILKQLNAFFVEPNMNDFYQISIMGGPFNYPSNETKIGVIDLENDNVVKIIDSYMNAVMNQLKYKKGM